MTPDCSHAQGDGDELIWAFNALSIFLQLNFFVRALSIPSQVRPCAEGLLTCPRQVSRHVASPEVASRALSIRSQTFGVFALTIERMLLTDVLVFLAFFIFYLITFCNRRATGTRAPRSLMSRYVTVCHGVNPRAQLDVTVCHGRNPPYSWNGPISPGAHLRMPRCVQTFPCISSIRVRAT